MKTALITGAARGIGLATARAFVKAGWRVLALDKDFGSGFDLPEAEVLQFDLRNVERIRDLVEEQGDIHTLVNNAGVLYCDPFDAIPEQHRREILAVNLEAPAVLTECVSVRMRRQPRDAADGVAGRIVNVGSVAAFTGHKRRDAGTNSDRVGKPAPRRRDRRRLPGGPAPGLRGRLLADRCRTPLGVGRHAHETAHPGLDDNDRLPLAEAGIINRLPQSDGARSPRLSAAAPGCQNGQMFPAIVFSPHSPGTRRARLRWLLLLGWLASSQALALPDPQVAGPYAVGHETVLLVDPARNNRAMPTDIWYPAPAGSPSEPKSFYRLQGPIGIPSSAAAR